MKAALSLNELFNSAYSLKGENNSKTNLCIKYLAVHLVLRYQSACIHFCLRHNYTFFVFLTDKINQFAKSAILLRILFVSNKLAWFQSLDDKQLFFMYTDTNRLHQLLGNPLAIENSFSLKVSKNKFPSMLGFSETHLSPTSCL